MTNIPFPYRLLIPVSLVVLVFSFLFEAIIEDYSLIIGLSLILLLGIPHGSTDYKIYSVTRKGHKLGLFSFIIRYLGIMAAYGILWWLFPGFSLLVFLLMSVYHFGESNWHKYEFTGFERGLVYVLYGLFYLVSPILLNWDESRKIILQILDMSDGLLLPEGLMLLPGLLYLLVLAFLFYFYLNRKIDRKTMIMESISVSLLLILYIKLPLLPAFAMYFVFWHSLVSMKDQKDAIAQVQHKYNWKAYFKDAAPFSIAAVATMIALAFFIPDLALRYVSLLFILISMLTMPHMILIENLIQRVPLKVSHSQR
jgi:Brp/Blh family beta-carotene 15,15'-monooxygenase